MRPQKDLGSVMTEIQSRVRGGLGVGICKWPHAHRCFAEINIKGLQGLSVASSTKLGFIPHSGHFPTVKLGVIHFLTTLCLLSFFVK